MKGVIRKGLGIGAGLLLLVPASALAGTASLDPGGIPRYQAAANEVNNVHVGELPGTTSVNKTVVFMDAVPIGLSRLFSPEPEHLARRPLHHSGVQHAGAHRARGRKRPAAAGGRRRTGEHPFLERGRQRQRSMVGTVNRDVLDGESGNDSIRGREGDDGLEGGGGDDTVSGEDGNDTLLGGAQSDELNGGAGRDSMGGGTGNDNLNASDNAGGDTVDCGEHLFDDDFGLANLGDLVTRCERVTIVP